MITYDNLWKTMKENGITQCRLIHYHDFNQGMFRRIKNNLHCNIEDIITFVPDENAKPVKIMTKSEFEMERVRRNKAEQERNDTALHF